MTNVASFAPTWVSPPGDTIADLLEERGWAQNAFAERMGFTAKHIGGLVRGEVPISAESARRLATVLGSTTEFWLTREAHYRAALERVRVREELRGDVGWLKELPVAWMVARGLIVQAAEKAEQVAAALQWFGVASVEAWRKTYGEPLAAFRASTRAEKKLGAVATWLRATELDAASAHCEPFDLQAFREELPKLRALAAESEPTSFVPQLRRACATSGVAVVFFPAPPGCPIHGATKWLTPTKALLGLSLRYKTNDQLWFSFFHEAAHLIKHGKKLLVIEGLDGLDREKEDEANRFAADILIPPDFARSLRTKTTETAIRAYAREIGVAAGVLVGRMQHEGWISHAQFNHLKVFYTWDKART